MAQHYSNPERAGDKWSLPDVETFEQAYDYCPTCGSLMQDEDAKGHVHCLECATSKRPTKRGWFYWFCLPGCLPDSEPFGPYETEQAAIADAQDQD